MAEVYETGDIVFLYRPQVDEPDPDALDDVQQAAIVLRPHGDGWRHIVLGQGQLPDPEASGFQQVWGFVESVGTDRGQLEQALASETYRTETRGQRTQPAYRPVGEGAYAVASYRGEVRLVYDLELPEQRGDVQKALNVTQQARLVLQVRNPQASAQTGQGLDADSRADYPQWLQEEFGGRQWIGAQPSTLLDYPGAEVLLVAAKAEVPDSLEDELGAEDEDAESADVFQTLALSRQEHPPDPLFGRSWE
jgi:hypothetical protein